MEGTSSTLTLGDSRRLALAAYDAACQQYGPAFGPLVRLTSVPHISDYVAAIGGDKEAATLAALRSSHESNCPRMHDFASVTDVTDASNLEVGIAKWRNQD